MNQACPPFLYTTDDAIAQYCPEVYPDATQMLPKRSPRYPPDPTPIPPSLVLMVQQEIPVRRILGLLNKRIPQLFQEPLKALLRARRHPNTDEDLADVGAVVAVVEEGDAEFGLEVLEERAEGVGSLGKFWERS
jgi:hypothetical protein